MLSQLLDGWIQRVDPGKAFWVLFCRSSLTFKPESYLRTSNTHWGITCKTIKQCIPNHGTFTKGRGVSQKWHVWGWGESKSSRGIEGENLHWYRNGSFFFAYKFFREKTSKTWAVEWHFHWTVSAPSPAPANTICHGGGTAANWNSSPGSFLKAWQDFTWQRD